MLIQKTSKIHRVKIFVFVFTFIFVLLCNAFVVLAADTAIEAEKKYIALTFDDGPHPEYTEKVLDILEEKNVPATFFVVGFRAEVHRDTILRMKKLNCEVGNHTYEHKHLKKISRQEALTEIRKCSDIIFDITGEYPKIYRPPFGEIGKGLEKEIAMTKILWTIDSSDWRIKYEKSQVVNNIVPKANENSIILLHDFYKATVAALPEIIDKLQAEGFEFITISELLKIDNSAGSKFGDS